MNNNNIRQNNQQQTKYVLVPNQNNLNKQPVILVPQFPINNNQVFLPQIQPQIQMQQQMNQIPQQQFFIPQMQPQIQQPFIQIQPQMQQIPQQNQQFIQIQPQMPFNNLNNSPQNIQTPPYNPYYHQIENNNNQNGQNFQEPLRPNKQISLQSNTINFTINGKAYNVEDPDPTMTLNEFIRSQRGLKGTKITCGEGGCGNCTVMVTTQDKTLGKEKNIAINSCLRLLCSCDGDKISTIESLGNLENLNPIQEKIVENNGTQCGFCTPGWIMNFHSMVKDDPNITPLEIQSRLDGNLCRCTGYRSIFSSFKELSEEKKLCSKMSGMGCSDIEELGCKNICGNHNHNKNNNKSIQLKKKNLKIQPKQSDFEWLTVSTLKDLYNQLDLNKGKKVKLVVGNTGYGVFPELYDLYIDITNIPELKTARASYEDGGAVLGAAVTINDFIFLMKQWIQGGTFTSNQTKSWVELVEGMARVATDQVRNAACWAGNLMMAHSHLNFPSDLMTLFLGIGAKLTIGSNLGVITDVPIDDFIKLDMSQKVVLNIKIPLTAPGENFKFFKVALRHVNSHSIVNAAMKFFVNTSGLVIQMPTIAFGGIRSTAVRMGQTEIFLYDNNIKDPSVLSSALQILEKELNPVVIPEGREEYRKQLALSYFYKMYLSLQTNLPSYLVSATETFKRPVSGGEQSFSTDPNEYPVSQPIPKLESKLQVTGEAVYTDDTPDLEGTLYAVLVCSTVAKATLLNVDPSEALSMPGVVSFLSAKDIDPSRNKWGPEIQDELVFVENEINYYGQPIGIVLAKTHVEATRAAEAVKLFYSNISKPILTIQEAIQQNSFFPDNPNFPTGSPLIAGNVEQGFQNSDNIITGTFEQGSQYHFYMETQTVYCKPQENNGMSIIGSLQSSALAQSVVSQVLGVPQHNVIVENTRCGGGYGGKASRNCVIFTACAFAAQKLDRPVKMRMGFEPNMNTIGKRTPMRFEYKVGTKGGLLQALEINFYVDQGAFLDAGNGSIMATLFAIDNVYSCANWKITGTLCRTNKPPNTATRGPGWTPAIACIEHIMTHLSTSLNVSLDTLKQNNFYKKGDTTPFGNKLTTFPIPTIWQQLQTNCNYQQRKTLVEQYNNSNRWTKKGIVLQPVRFGVYWSGSNYSSLINIYPDGTVAISIAGIEIGQGLNTKVAQACAMAFKIPLDLIRIYNTGTVTVPNSAGTGGSTTSELCVMSTLDACDQINKRINSVRLLYKEGKATWQETITKAMEMGIDVSAKGWTNPNSPNGPQRYSSYGAVCTETYLDILTGETQIIRVDILFDCGISMNPAIDIGQVEGAFTMGLGLHMTEDIVYDENGKLLTNSTWNYKIPMLQDIPITFNVSLLKDAPNPNGVLSSRAVGEPPLTLGISFLLSVQNAINSHLSSFKKSPLNIFSSPCTVDKIQQACSLTIKDFTLN